jgi:hypothetical protein
MHSNLTHQIASANQRELLRRAEMSRLAAELPGRPSPLARFVRSIPSPSFSRRSAKLPRTAQATTPGR